MVSSVDKEDVLEEVRSHIYIKATGYQKYITERDIGNTFNLKRGISRELLLSMEGEGILKRVPQKGYRFVDYNNTDHEAVMAVRYTLEREAARKAMTVATREDILRIILAYEDMGKYKEENNPEKFREADIEFHKAIITASHDNMLKNMFSFISIPVFKMNEPTNEKMGNTNAGHFKILSALRGKNLPALEDALKKHYKGKRNSNS
ncbi:MAG: GntR family transcriptional regulator [Victivallales bacterium]